MATCNVICLIAVLTNKTRYYPPKVIKKMICSKRCSIMFWNVTKKKKLVSIIFLHTHVSDLYAKKLIQKNIEIKENPKKIKINQKNYDIFFPFSSLESSEMYTKKCSAMISLCYHEIILLAMNDKKLRETNVLAERRQSIWILEDCLFFTHETVKFQNTLLKANRVCSIQYKFV